MTAVVLTLLIATLLAAAGMLVKMYRDDEPLLGGLGVCLLVGPGAALTFLHAGLTG